MINAETPSHPTHPRMGNVLKPLLQAKLLLLRKYWVQRQTPERQLLLCVHLPARAHGPTDTEVQTDLSTAAHLAVGVGSWDHSSIRSGQHWTISSPLPLALGSSCRGSAPWLLKPGQVQVGQGLLLQSLPPWHKCGQVNLDKSSFFPFGDP